MDTVSYDKRQRKVARDKVVRAVVWVAGILLILVLLPGLVATVWVPSCTTCHNDEAFLNQTEEMSHSTIDCRACHGGLDALDALQYREKVVYEMTLKLLPSTPKDLAFVPSQRCESCHGKVYEETTVSNGIRIAHNVCAPLGVFSQAELEANPLVGETTSNCVDCHSTVAHGKLTIAPTQYDMMDCLRCHAQEGVSGDGGCNFCHVGSHDSPAPTAGTEFKSTHGPSWQKTHGMGDMSTCTACHPGDYCEPCHGAAVPHPANFIMSHGSVAKASNNQCFTCHVSEKSFCMDCHRIPMPHPSNFLEQHSSAVQEVGEETCYNCHGKADCEGCHAAHIHPGGAF